MNHPVLYHNSNNLQRYDSEDILKEFRDKFQHSSNSCELLDIGCGDGYVTTTILLDYISKNIHVTAIDKAESMINFASHNFYGSNVKFEVMNIADKLKESFIDKFDFITSFYCFHWVEDQYKLMQNIYSLMKPRGRCLFIFPLSHPIYDAYKILMMHPEWFDVMKNANCHIPKLQNARNPIAEYTETLQKVGFKNIKIEIRNKDFLYTGMEDFKDFALSVNPFIDKVSSFQKEEYTNDLMEALLSLPSVTKHSNICANKECINTNYSLLVGYYEK